MFRLVDLLSFASERKPFWCPKIFRFRIVFGRFAGVSVLSRTSSSELPPVGDAAERQSAIAAKSVKRQVRTGGNVFCAAHRATRFIRWRTVHSVLAHCLHAIRLRHAGENTVAVIRCVFR